MSLMAAGMAGGALLGGYSAMEGNKDARRKNKAIEENELRMQAEIADTEAKRSRTLGEQYAPMVGADFAGDTQRYYNELGNVDYSQFNLQAPEDFTYDMQAETQSRMNPMIQDIINRSTGEVTNSAANAGKLFSGSAAKDVARSTADIQAKEYEKAANLAQTDRTNKYQQWTDKFNQARLIAESGKENLQSGLKNKSELYGLKSGAYGSQINKQQDVQNASDTARLQSKQRGFDANAASKGMGSDLLAGLGGALSGASNVYGTFGGINTEK
jgi:hypothetical protein